MPNTSTSKFGELLPCGRIVRFRHPDVDFDKACADGPAQEMEYFSEVIAGLRVGHADSLRELGFFRRVRDRLQLNVDVGSWEELTASDLYVLDRIIEEILPPDGGIRNLLQDIRQMAAKARSEHCSIGFML